ncbi:hypothetical protein LMG5997_06570 [Achromobacter insolitus]|nr:hypothetical protein LMG5997_06570 [Achromobacter insolitus]
MRHGAVEVGYARDVNAIAGATGGIGMHAVDGVLAEGQVAVDGKRAHGRAVIAGRNDRGGIEIGGTNLTHAGQHDFAADIHGAVQLAVDFQRAVGDQDGTGETAAIGGQDHRARAGLDEALRALQRVVDGVDELTGRIGAVANHDRRGVAAAADQSDRSALQAIPIGSELNARHAHRTGAAVHAHGASGARENGIATVGQRSRGVARAVPVRAAGAPGAVAAARLRRGCRAIAVPQVGRARTQDQVDLLVARKCLDGCGGGRVAGDRTQRQAVPAQAAAVRQDPVVPGIDAQGVDRHVQRGVVDGRVAAHGDVVARAGLRDGQPGIAGLEIKHGVVHRQVAVDDQVAVGDSGRRADFVSGSHARTRHVEIAIDRAEARDGAVRVSIDVPAQSHPCSTAVAADHQRAAADIDPTGEIDRTVEHLRIARPNGQVRSRDATAVGRAQRERRRQPFLCVVYQRKSSICRLIPETSRHYWIAIKVLLSNRPIRMGG